MVDCGNVVVAPVTSEDDDVVASVRVVVVSAGATAVGVVDLPPPKTGYPREAVAFFSCVPNTPIPAVIAVPITAIKQVIAMAEAFRCLFANRVKWLLFPTLRIILSPTP